ncbi:MAG: adenylate/guanylate cyclase domain-containing protein, partial [Planctomycetaceae bacterium]|nr:adenylate/guanylate cyclase domain-containing protein [Planctomycetaceae bacterium]
QHIIIKDRYVSRQQMRLTVCDEGIQVSNIGSAEAKLQAGQTIAPGGMAIVQVPTTIGLGRTTVKLGMNIELPEGSRNIATISAPVFNSVVDTPATATLSGDTTPEGATIANWLESILTVQQSAAGSPEFYQETADAVVKSIGLDHGMVLLLDKHGWRSVAESSHKAVDDLIFSRSVLQRMRQEARTFYEPVSEMDSPQSLANVDSVVASPVFGSDGEVIGSVYGAREQMDVGGAGITPLEAQVMQLLACSVSAGLARIEREAKVARLRIQFEEFVSPELASELERDPTFLEGQQRSISCLFADLRNFSAISETMGAEGIYAMMRDVMDALTQCVLDAGGAIINYAGDGMAAMWNAPLDQADHAQRACRAALAIQAAMPALNDKWAERAGMPLKVGIGINSGEALVGNAGSRHRIKYGPMGHTVNLASRVEGATKQLGVSILITDRSQQLIGDEFLVREVCQVRVVGIQQAATVFELQDLQVKAQWRRNKEIYENALVCFCNRQFAECIAILERVMETTGFIDDRPSLLLSLWAHEGLGGDPEKFDPVYNLDAK